MDIRQGTIVRRAFQAPTALAQSRGFTLIEVAFAILVLAASLITILGLQSSIIARSTHDKNSQRAMLRAREILSALEVVLRENKTIPDGDKEGRPSEILASLLGAAPPGSEEDDGALQARLSVINWNIEGVPPDLVLIKKVDLRVLWGAGPGESIDVTYFIPEEPTGT